MYKNELTFYDHESGMQVAKALINEHYVVMLSLEEQLLVINYEWSHSSNRNDVVFMPRDEYEEELDKCGSEIYEDIRTDIKNGYIKTLADIQGYAPLYVGIAQLVEHRVANAEVEGS